MIWTLAVVFAVVNGLFVLRRVPILRAQSGTPDERAAQAAAVWLRQEPATARVMLLRSHADLGAIWFDFRLNYLTYPRRHDLAWEALPPNARRDYDLVLAVGRARAAMPPDWTVLRRTDFCTLYSSGSSLDLGAEVRPAAASLPSPLRVAAGVIGLAVVILLGALLLGWTVTEAPFTVWWANLALAHLVGATALSWLITMVVMATGRLYVWPVYALLLLLLPNAGRAILVGRARRFDRSEQEIDAGDAAEPSGPAVSRTATPATEVASDRAGLLYVYGLLAVIGLGGLMLVLNGWMLGVGWDGYSIWQLKAQAFLIDGDFAMLRDPHYSYYAHVDYPLLVPLQTWWVGMHYGRYAEGVAQSIGTLFTLDMVALFIAFARRRVSRLPLLMGVGLLITTPAVCTHAVSGFADIEVACYLLAMGILLSRITISGETRLWPVLAWIFAGIVLVKNEGLLAALGGFVVLLTMQRRSELRGIARYLAAVAVAYLPWYARKRSWHLNNDLLESGRMPHFTTGLVRWRLYHAVMGFVQNLAQTGPRAGGWGLLVVILPIGFAATIRRHIRICLPLWWLCGIQFIGYVMIYIITWQPLLAHIRTSVDRLILHLVPTLLLAALLGTFADPDSPTAASGTAGGTRRAP